jgi:hypothetical protein
MIGWMSCYQNAVERIENGRLSLLIYAFAHVWEEEDAQGS